MRPKHKNNGKREKKVILIVPRTANYLRFLAFIVSGSYAPVVLRPRLLWCFYAHLFDYETENKDESKFAFSTPEKVAAQSLLKMPDCWQLLDKPDEDHSGHHPENEDKRQDAVVTFDAESPHDHDLDMKLPAVHPVADDSSKSSSIHGDIISITEIEKPPPVAFLDFSLEVPSASSNSSEDILGLFDQDPGKKKKPLKGTNQEYSIEVV